MYHLNDEVHVAVDTNGVVEQEHINGETLTVTDHDVAGGELFHSRRDGDEPKLGRNVRVLVKEEEISVCEVDSHHRKEKVLKTRLNRRQTSLLTKAMLRLSKLMNASTESALTPAPAHLDARLMVVQMLPVRWTGW